MVVAVKQTVLSISLAVITWYFIEDPVRHGKWKRQWAQLYNGLKLRPRLLRFRGKASFTSAICIFSLLILAVSGCSMIQAQQSISPSELSTRETTTADTENAKSNDDGTEASSTTDTTNRDTEHNHSCNSSGVDVVDGSVMPGENSLETPSANDAVNKSSDQKDGFTGKGVTVIGDSVMVGVEPELKRLYPDIIVDAAIGRQMHQAPQVITNLERRGALGNTVVIGLGSNGAFTEKQITDILSLLGSDRGIVIINARVPKPWESAVNQVLARTADLHPNVELVNWYSASSGHDEYFYADGVHLKEAGVRAYVALLAKAVNP